MKRLSVVALTAAVSFAAPSFAQAPVSDQTANQAARTIAEQFETAYNKGDAPGLARLVAQDGVLLTPAGTMMTDHQAMANAWASRMKAGWTREEVKVLEAHPSGNEVWVFGTYSITGSGAVSGKTIGGYWDAVLTQDGSNWRYRLLMGNLKPVQDVTGMGATAR